MHKDYLLARWKYEVWLARQTSPMKAEPVSQSVRMAANEHFGLHPLALDSAHVCRALFWGDPIHLVSGLLRVGTNIEAKGGQLPHDLPLDERKWNMQSDARCSTLRQADHMTPSKNRITVNLSDEEAAQLAELAERTKVSKAWLGRHAICSLLERAHNDDKQFQLPFVGLAEGGSK